MSFVGLHIHSDYSLLDGASQLPQLIDRAIELGMPAIAITDHGVMYGAVELIKVCRTKNIKPIIGNEMYVINGDIHEKSKRKQKYHQVVLAKNNQGYRNLVKLTTISHLDGLQGKGIMQRPCVNKELLKEYREGLIVTSACLGGEVPQEILKGDLKQAREVAKWYQEVFGDDYYLEIQDHGSVEDRIVNVEIIKIARELGIKFIATNDSHFISCYDVEAHDALLCIQTNKLLTEDKRLRYSGTEYLKSAQEMARLFRDHLPDDVIQEAIATTLEVADKVKPYTIMGEPRIPDYPVPNGHTADTFVEQIAWDGLLNRFGYRSRSEVDPVYKQRLEYELKMIEKMGFSTYFLVVWDYIKFARDQKIPVGPGRGSAAGSLVAYALRITNIDPVHHGLLFERFLNPERKSMPDIDTDFCIERRDEVIDYVTKKYGKERVAQIITFNRMTSKAVLRDVARVLEIPLPEADKMAKMIPVSRGKPAKLKEMISDQTPAPEFKQAYQTDERVRRWVDMAIRIEGTNKTYGVHAAGVVISAEPLDQIVPLQRNNDGSVITQYFMEDLESMGLLKMDFLGLRNLTMIQKTLDLIYQKTGQVVDPDSFTSEERRSQERFARIKKLPEDVEKTYKILEKGDLEGIFQLESSGMRQVVRELKPSSIEDISSILALYRPGPLDANLIPKFIERKHGREPIKYEHHLLEPILKETYGILVYQESIMKMAQDLAGYTLGQADLLRRAMGKKKSSEMQKQKESFIEGATKNGITTKIAEELFAQMVKFAEYCFNKSHSTAYAYVTYQTAYLKANYQVEYMAALLTAHSGSQDKIQKYIATCSSMKIEVEPPNINRSGIDFTPGKNTILFGLSAIRNLGEGAIQCILAAREKDGEFKSLADFCDRVDLRTVNRRALEALIYCGAFDTLEKNRNKLINNLDLVMSWASKRAQDRQSGQGNLFNFYDGVENASFGLESAPKAPDVPDFSQSEKLKLEKDLLGFYVSDHPLKSLQQAAQIFEPIILADLESQSAKGYVSAIVMLTSIKVAITKKGDQMAILQLEDMSGNAEAIVFPETYKRISSHLVEEARLIIWGKVDCKDEKVQLLVDDAEAIEEVNMVVVQLTPHQACDISQQHRLKTVLQQQSGDTKKSKVPVVAMIVGDKTGKLVRLNRKFWVRDSKTAVYALKTANFLADFLPITTTR